MRRPTDVVTHSRVSQQQRLEYEPIHHHSTQWLIHALNHIITQFGSTINVLINLKGPKVYVILVILIGASYAANRTENTIKCCIAIFIGDSAFSLVELGYLVVARWKIDRFLDCVFDQNVSILK